MESTRISRYVLSSLAAIHIGTAAAATIQQDFTSNPLELGWKVFGDPALFVWDTSQHHLQVTWDSSRQNSYYYHSLGTVLNRQDDFAFGFDLRLEEIGPGHNSTKPYPLQLAIGLLNFEQAIHPGFVRGTLAATNLVEFNYFRPTEYPATVWPALVSTNGMLNYNGQSDYTVITITPGDWFRVEMSYTASNSTLRTTITRNGEPSGPANPVVLSSSFTDFRVDTFSITSFTDAGDDYNSLLAKGVIDNVQITLPPPPVSEIAGAWSAGIGQVQFAGRLNWVYTLERSEDLRTWTAASAPVPGTGLKMSLEDTTSGSPKAFYRVRAYRP
jgi:hypothetical protein